MFGNVGAAPRFIQFEQLYKVFEEPPYEEKFTTDEVKEIYDELISMGNIIGYYIDGECIGCAAYRKSIEGEHPVKYENYEKVAYFAEFIVDNDYRRHGIGTILMKEMLECIKRDGYTKVYMRTLNPKDSKSYGIAVKCGFTLIDGVVQEVKGPRTNEDRNEVDIRIFLEKDIK